MHINFKNTHIGYFYKSLSIKIGYKQLGIRYHLHLTIKKKTDDKKVLFCTARLTDNII